MVPYAACRMSIYSMLLWAWSVLPHGRHSMPVASTSRSWNWCPTQLTVVVWQRCAVYDVATPLKWASRAPLGNLVSAAVFVMVITLTLYSEVPQHF